jgi:hypothetical protein
MKQSADCAQAGSGGDEEICTRLKKSANCLKTLVPRLAASLDPAPIVPLSMLKFRQAC